MIGDGFHLGQLANPGLSAHRLHPEEESAAMHRVVAVH